jgi:pimeloyl-ACP methyl ester carboxylesterase
VRAALKPSAAVAVWVVCLALAASASATVRVHWMPGYRAPDTPARYDKVGVLKIGSAHARNVLVLVPGTSAGAAYFVPLARWIVAREKGWQVWSLERRENLLEDQSELDKAKTGKASATQLFDYYLGFLAGVEAKHHFRFIPDSSVEFAKQWGMKVAVNDLRRVIEAARKLGGKVVLGGHSLGGGVVTAYATWNFGGHSGASQLAGLVYIDGGSFRIESAATASAGLAQLESPTASPWQPFGGIPTPYVGLLTATGALAALIDPGQRSLGQSSGLLTPFHLTAPVPVDNLAQFGYALNVPTSLPALAAAQAHLGTGIAATGNPRAWDGKGALTPIKRYAQMLAGAGVQGADGTEWYFPARLTLDLRAIGHGVQSPAERVLGLQATLGRRLPHRLAIYAFGAALGGRVILHEARQLAVQSHIPLTHLTLINRHHSYAHNDPNGAYPRNVFFAHLIPFLSKVAGR